MNLTPRKEIQKLASLGYVGLQKGSGGVNPAGEGTDPKDAITAINKVLDAMRDLDDGKPEKAIPALRQVIALQPTADVYARLGREPDATRERAKVSGGNAKH